MCGRKVAIWLGALCSSQCQNPIPIMTMKKYDSWNKDRLIEEIKKLSNRKKYGLVWEDKPEAVVTQCAEQLPVLEEVSDRAIEKDSSDTINHIIQGDNYHALSVLNYTHAGKVDVIYIDPPYNTGAKNWKYNNSFVDSEDSYRHSKWISFMESRLKLARSLLTKDGILVCAIDHYEVFNLGLLLDEIFGEKNRLGFVSIVNKADGRSDDKFFATSHEYLLFYARDSCSAAIGDLPLSKEAIKKKYPKKDKRGRYVEKPLMSQGVDSLKTDRPTLFFPLYFSEREDKLFVKKKPNSIEILPVDIRGIERRWSSGTTRIQEHIDAGDIVVKKSRNGKFYPYRKKRAVGGVKPTTVWTGAKYNSATHGTKLLNTILGKGRTFDYPKSLHAVIDALRVMSKDDSVILDFFAGSGTTGHATMALNQEDGGNRRFILCTNNENGISEEVTYPRIRKVIEGYEDVDGIPANLRYFKTTFVPRSDVSDDTRRELIKKSTEMICLKESTFKKVSNNKRYKIYQNNSHATGVLFDLDSLDEFKEKLEKTDQSTNIYVFSLTNDAFVDDFVDLKVKHNLRPIPEGILEVYRRIFS
jgi:adenine-specific DNA-methyltransferase